MSLIGKPVVNSTTAFDINSVANSNENLYTINFKWNGQKCNGNRLTIIETNKNHDITGLSSTYHTLTKAVCNLLGLVNGNTYHATITMLDFNGNPISNPSDQFLLYCYSTPVFEIRNIVNHSSINTTEFMALLNYKSYGMALASYKFNLYNETGSVLLDSSKELYETANEDTTDYSFCSYTFKGLEDNTSYCIQAKGITVYGMELDCSYYFTVKVNQSTIYNSVSTKATRDGNITLDINCIPMGYKSNGVSYVNDNEVNLTNKDSYVEYTLIKPVNDFKFIGLLRGVKDLNKPVLSFSTTDNDKMAISLIPKCNYNHSTLISNLKNFNWEQGSFSFVPNSTGNYYIDTTYYDASDSITLNQCYDDYFYIHCYDENYIPLDCDNGANGIKKFYFANRGTTYDTSFAKYVRFSFPKKSDYTDYQTKVEISMNYTDEFLEQLIRPQVFKYKDSTFIDFIVNATMSLNLYVNNRQYTYNSDYFDLTYNDSEDKFYFDDNIKLKVEITRENGIYKLNVIQIKDGD